MLVRTLSVAERLVVQLVDTEDPIFVTFEGIDRSRLADAVEQQLDRLIARPQGLRNLLVIFMQTCGRSLTG